MPQAEAIHIAPEPAWGPDARENSDGTRNVWVRNPHGVDNHDPKNVSGVNDGVIMLSWDEFKTSFQGIRFMAPVPAGKPVKPFDDSVEGRGKVDVFPAPKPVG